MTTPSHWMNVTGILPGTLIVTVAASVVLATVVLEMFALRLEGGGSLTTMFPGFVYTNVLILKVRLVEAAVLFLTSIARRALGWSLWTIDLAYRARVSRQYFSQHSDH